MDRARRRGDPSCDGPVDPFFDHMAGADSGSGADLHQRVRARPPGAAAPAACLLAAGALAGLLAGPASAASKWTVALAKGGNAQARSTSPATPTGISSQCVSRSSLKIDVSWSAATYATNYTVYEKETSGSYSDVATVTTTSWTSGTLSNGSYQFEVSTSLGSWTSSRSSATSSLSITSRRTTKCD